MIWREVKLIVQDGVYQSLGFIHSWADVHHQVPAASAEQRVDEQSDPGRFFRAFVISLLLSSSSDSSSDLCDQPAGLYWSMGHCCCSCDDRYSRAAFSAWASSALPIGHFQAQKHWGVKPWERLFLAQRRCWIKIKLFSMKIHAEGLWETPSYVRKKIWDDQCDAVCFGLLSLKCLVSGTLWARWR